MWEYISAECNPCLGLDQGCFTEEKRCFLLLQTLTNGQTDYTFPRLPHPAYSNNLIGVKGQTWQTKELSGLLCKKDYIDIFISLFKLFVSLVWNKCLKESLRMCPTKMMATDKRCLRGSLGEKTAADRGKKVPPCREEPFVVSTSSVRPHFGTCYSAVVFEKQPLSP